MSFAYFATQFAQPFNFAVGLALSQLFFLPTALLYYQATKTTPRDMADVRSTLRARAEATPYS